jgi:hypothetical protein
MSCLVARYKMTFEMPLRLAVGERAMAIAGRFQDRLQATRARAVTSPEVATYRICRTAAAPPGAAQPGPAGR